MIRVIIADDHTVLRQGLRNLFASCLDIEIAGEARDGFEALDLIGSARPDVAVLDISMPGLDGIEIARQIQKQQWTTRVVVLTMHKSPITAKVAMASGVSGYLLKDDAFEDLIYAVRKTALGGTYISPAIANEVLRSSTSGEKERELTRRELEVLGYIGRGMTNKQIAAALQLSVKTVETHRSRIMRKLDVHTTAELVHSAIKCGLG